MLKPYVVSMEGPQGLVAVIFEAANDAEAFMEAAQIVAERSASLDADSVVEVMRPDATPIEARPTVAWMAHFSSSR